MQVALVFEDNLTVMMRGAYNGKVGKLCQLLDFTGTGIVGEKVKLSVPVAEEVDQIADPHGVYIVATPFRFGNFHL